MEIFIIKKRIMRGMLIFGLLIYFQTWFDIVGSKSARDQDIMLIQKGFLSNE